MFSVEAPRPLLMKGTVYHITEEAGDEEGYKSGQKNGEHTSMLYHSSIDSLTSCKIPATSIA